MNGICFNASVSMRYFREEQLAVQPIVSLLNRETHFSIAKYRRHRNYLTAFRENLWEGCADFEGGGEVLCSQSLTERSLGMYIEQPAHSDCLR
jgi:hypothetical protein